MLPETCFWLQADIQCFAPGHTQSINITIPLATRSIFGTRYEGNWSSLQKTFLAAGGNVSSRAATQANHQSKLPIAARSTVGPSYEGILFSFSSNASG